MRIETVKISKLIKNPDNPRTIKDKKFELLKQSIVDFPEMLELREIVVDENYMILGGNMRYEAQKALGYTDVTIKIADGLTNEQKKQFIIKDNANFGDWDFDELANSWELPDLQNWGVDLPNWDLNDIQEVTEFNESVNFIIKCKDLKEIELLQSKLGIQSNSITYDKFIEIVGL